VRPLTPRGQPTRKMRERIELLSCLSPSNIRSFGFHLQLAGDTLHLQSGTYLSLGRMSPEGTAVSLQSTALDQPFFAPSLPQRFAILPTVQTTLLDRHRYSSRRRRRIGHGSCELTQSQDCMDHASALYGACFQRVLSRLFNRENQPGNGRSIVSTWRIICSLLLAPHSVSSEGNGDRRLGGCR